MSYVLSRRARAFLAALAAGVVGVLIATTAPVAHKATPSQRSVLERLMPQQGQAGGESAELKTAGEQYQQSRVAPAGLIEPGAYGAAFGAFNALPSSGGSWSEVTNKPYDSDDLRYRDPYWSNTTGGMGYVTGRVTGLAVNGSTIYAGGAAGGVFKSTDGGTTWTAISDDLPSLSTGDLKIIGGNLWLATGESNTGATSYVGAGVFVWDGSTWTRVGGSELESHLINKLTPDGAGNVYAATSRGVYKHAASATSAAWTRVLTPVTADPGYYDNIANDVVVQPGTGGRVVLANVAWRGGAAYNGFYLSTSYGAAGSWRKINPGGAINPKEIGNAEFAYSADGKKLYTVVESTFLYNKPNVQTGNTVLAGVYASNNGSVAGPWTLIADYRKLQRSTGSALFYYKGYAPGVQAWYNNFIAVDPANANHVFLGLEEVYETWNGGSNWTTAGPYWNFSFRCWSFDPAQNTCNPTTHPDQHSIAFGGGKVYVGNDGGVYSRNVSGGSFAPRNQGLRLLQYYGVGVGAVSGGYAVWGGLQDNGVSLLRPGDTKMGSPEGGDGGKVLVDPADGCKAVNEYVFLTMTKTLSCGVSDGTQQVITTIAPADPNPRFIAPFEFDASDSDHWVAGGQIVWTSDKGWDTETEDWAAAYTTPGSVTTLASTEDVVYAGWCGPCNAGSTFKRGVATNADGTWKELALTGLPNRYVSGVAIDPADTDHAYVLFSGFSRRWNEGPGAGLGHLFETTDGGAHWTNRTGNFPDVPTNDISIVGSRLIVATDLGVVQSTDNGAHWSRVGGGTLPVTTVTDLHVGPDGNLYAATHGRGIWKIAL